MVKRGLGRGFDSLIPTDVLDSEFDTTAAEDERVSDLRLLNIQDVQPNPDQPRRRFDDDDLACLANSIREHGVLQPIVVTPRGGKFEIVAGERRYRAANIAGLTKIPAIVRTLSAQHKLEVSIIENVQRQDLNPLETATAFLKLRNQFNLTDKQIGERVGKAASTVSNITRLLKLPDVAKQALADGKITEGHARQILAIEDPDVQQRLLEEIIANKWSVGRTEQFVIGYKSDGATGKKSVDGGKKAVRTETDFTRSIAKRLGFKSNSVTQKTTAHGGQIIIKYRSDEDITKISEILGL